MKSHTGNPGLKSLPEDFCSGFLRPENIRHHPGLNPPTVDLETTKTDGANFIFIYNPLVLQPTEGQVPLTDCSPHFQISLDRCERSPIQFKSECAQHVESPSHYWIYRSQLSLKVSDYLNSSRCWIDDSLLWPKFLSPAGDRTKAASRKRRWNTMF